MGVEGILKGETARARLGSAGSTVSFADDVFLPVPGGNNDGDAEGSSTGNSTGRSIPNISRREPDDRRRTLGVPSLVALLYFTICGGPVGAEPIFSAYGPLVGLIGLVVWPIVYCTPIALATAEMSAALPRSGGFIHWVLAAFGPTAAFFGGFVSWGAGVATNALYPARRHDSAGALLHSAFHSHGLDSHSRVAIALHIPARSCSTTSWCRPGFSRRRRQAAGRSARRSRTTP